VEAEYILYYVETEGENVIEFRKAVNISKEIMRALVLVHEKDFPFNRRTTKDMVIQKRERKPRFNKDAKKPAEKAESKNTNEDLTKLKKDELIKLASDKGVEVKASMKKADIIKAIEEA
jgi:ribosomal protein S6